jgi:hypothetical protein
MDDFNLVLLASKAANEEYDLATRNPLEKDDLALRLAVKLGLRILCFGDWISAGGDKDTNGKIEQCGNDPCAATRRAIVRAAAKIEKGERNES